MLGIALLATTTFAQSKKDEKSRPATPAVRASTVKLKADGTRDKRFRNPNAATPAVPATKVSVAIPAKPSVVVKLKADGTPDKRFKNNKNATITVGPTKKDGTLDMRYKVNKKG